MNQQDNNQLQVKINDNELKGSYVNNVIVNHTKEEFVLDCMVIFGKGGIVASRIISSPGHFKRMIRAMQENLKMYEEKFGIIKEAVGIEEKEIGFKA